MTPKLVRALLLVPLSSLLSSLWSPWSPVAFAQTRPDTTRREAGGTVVEADSGFRLPPVQVIGSILRSAGPAVGSGPARTLLVDEAEIAAWSPRLLPEVLERAGTITTYDDLGSAFKTTLVTRGFTASPVVGLPQGSRSSSTASRSTSPTRDRSTSTSSRWSTSTASSS